MVGSWLRASLIAIQWCARWPTIGLALVLLGVMDFVRANTACSAPADRQSGRTHSRCAGDLHAPDRARLDLPRYIRDDLPSGLDGAFGVRS